MDSSVGVYTSPVAINEVLLVLAFAAFVSAL